MKALLPFCAALLPALALAQGPAMEDFIGAGPRLRPAYDGSKTYHADVVPILSYYGSTLFARTTQGVLEGGARTELVPGLHAGAQLAYEEGRKTRESSFLSGRNVPSLDPSASLGAHVEGDAKLGPMPLNLLLRWRRDLRADRGSQLDLRATAGVYESGPLAAAVYAQATWATERSVRTYYGQPGFAPSGGPLYAAIGTYAGYDLSKKWELIANLEARRLRGDAAESPLAERRSSYSAIVGVAYRLGGQ
jgi:outer membrane scaffolding protein for murein synthesis (MipA/OmpV family)